MMLVANTRVALMARLLDLSTLRLSQQVPSVSARQKLHNDVSDLNWQACDTRGWHSHTQNMHVFQGEEIKNTQYLFVGVFWHHRAGTSHPWFAQ
jgi:hypothetical protein